MKKFKVGGADCPFIVIKDLIKMSEYVCLLMSCYHLHMLIIYFLSILVISEQGARSWSQTTDMRRKVSVRECATPYYGTIYTVPYTS